MACSKLLTLGNLEVVIPKLSSSMIHLFRFSIFLLLWLGWWVQLRADPLSALLIALLCYGTFEAIFWTCCLIVAFLSRTVLRRPSLSLRLTSMLTVRMILLSLIGLCGPPLIYAYIRFRQYLHIPMEDLDFEGERRTDFFDWMYNSHYAVHLVGPFYVLMMYLLIAFGAVEIIVLVGRGIDLLADRLPWRHKSGNKSA